jgi:D-galactarolactone cycloisomerase
MRITELETILLPQIPFPFSLKPAWGAGDCWNHFAMVVVKLHTDQGLVGIGASHAEPARRIREIVRPALIGQDPTQIEQHVAFLGRIGSAWAVEIALWDLLGKLAGLPLFKLWGAWTDKVMAYASLVEVGAPQQRAEDALRLYEEGFRALKLRIHHDTLHQDVALVQAVREAVGTKMEIMVDANQANLTPSQKRGPVWDLERAIWTANALESLGVRWLEEPLGRYDFSGLAQLCESVDLPIAGGENNRALVDFLHMVKTGAYDILQPDVVIVGISGTRKVATLAQMAGKLMVGHHGASGVGMAAQLHIHASCPNAPVIEYFYDPPGFPREVFQGVLAEPLIVDTEGYIHLPQKPGLGVELNDSFIQRYKE